MGIYPQPNSWECGPFALKYALMLLGIPGCEREIARIAGTDESGTDETELGRAAQHHGCELLLVRRETPEDAWSVLQALLGDQIPVLLCVNGWEHWVTAAATDGDECVVLDSRDPGVATVVPWERLALMVAYLERLRSGKVRKLYDLHPLMPQAPVGHRARLSTARARRLREPEHRSLAVGWDRYLADLLTICDAPTPQRRLTLSLSEVLRRSAADILRHAHRRVRTIDLAGRRHILNNVRFVAETYDLQIKVEDEQHVVAELGGIVSRRAAAALL